MYRFYKTERDRKEAKYKECLEKHLNNPNDKELLNEFLIAKEGYERDYSLFRFIHQDIEELFKKWWNWNAIPEEAKIELKQTNQFTTPECFTGKEFFKIIRLIRLPYLGIAIMEYGEIISINQLDDILDAVKISNGEYDKEVEKINEESARHPQDFSRRCVPIPPLIYKTVKEQDQLLEKYDNNDILKKINGKKGEII